MAAPSTTKWGTVGGGSPTQGRLGLNLVIDGTVLKAQIWFWSKDSVSDTNNTLYFDWNKTSATTSRGAVSVVTPSNSDWSTSNQILLKEYTITTAPSAISAKLTGVEGIGSATLTVSTTPPAYFYMMYSPGGYDAISGKRMNGILGSGSIYSKDSSNIILENGGEARGRYFDVTYNDGKQYNPYNFSTFKMTAPTGYSLTSNWRTTSGKVFGQDTNLPYSSYSPYVSSNTLLVYPIFQPNSYTQTMNFYKIDPDDGTWNYYTYKTQSAYYNSIFTPTTTGVTAPAHHTFSRFTETSSAVVGAKIFNGLYNPNTYSVIYDANLGTGAPSTTSYKYGQSNVKLSTTIPTRVGYEFIGWKASGPIYQPGTTWNTSIGTNVTLYAQWKLATNCFIKQDGVWKRAMMYKKDGGQWKTGVTKGKVNGVWKQQEE